MMNEAAFMTQALSNVHDAPARSKTLTWCTIVVSRSFSDLRWD